MSVVIRAENVSKEYVIRHQQKESYTALRDVIARKAKDALKPVNQLIRNDAPVVQKRENFFALNDVSFEIQQGDRMGIIGRNGAGKSTLLKVLSRITEPSSGKIGVKGRIASLLEVGTGFHPELTGRENIFLNGAILGMHRAEIKAKFDEIVIFSGVEKFLDTPVKRYSSGMYVRLAFAVAAHLESEILIIDEVLAVGDAEFQKKCLGKMQDASTKEGRTVLFVSHNMAAINILCNKGIVLNNGTLMESGEIKKVVSHYLTNEKLRASFDHLKGNGLISISKVWVNGGEYEGDAKINQPISIEVGLKMKEGIAFKNASFFVIIYDENDNDILSIFQKDSNDLFNTADIKERISIRFANSLRPGLYKISIGIFNEFNEFVDWVDNCFYLRVLHQFNNDEPFDNRLGKVISDAKFSLA